MGCWGITAFESDAGLDSVDYIRSNLPKGGKLDLGEIIDALQNDQIRLPDVEFAENHTSPMALAEIVVKFLDGDMDGLDYDEDWAKEQNKFRDITSFTASKVKSFGALSFSTMIVITIANTPSLKASILPLLIILFLVVRINTLLFL